MQILVVIHIRHYAAACRVVLKVVQHSVHLVELALGIDAFLSELPAVSLAYSAVLSAHESHIWVDRSATRLLFFWYIHRISSIAER